MAQRSYRWLFWVLAVGGVLLDQAAKYGIFRWLYADGGRDYRTVVPGLFEIEAVHTTQPVPAGWLAPFRNWSGPTLPMVNPGALFGQQLTRWLDWGFGSHLATQQPWVDQWFFSFISVLAVAGVVWWTTRSATARDRMLCLSLGLIVAGTVGNLYDRVVFEGVRDFLHVYYVPLQFDWPVFNLADCCLVFGAGLLTFQAFFYRPQTAKQSAPATAAQAPAVAGAK
jgi:lipoprotein signal peptidase